jgi:hypothetical protein
MLLPSSSSLIDSPRSIVGYLLDAYVIRPTVCGALATFVDTCTKPLAVQTLKATTPRWRRVNDDIFMIPQWASFLKKEGRDRFIANNIPSAKKM